jgi:hypothetical protein
MSLLLCRHLPVFGVRILGILCAAGVRSQLTRPNEALHLTAAALARSLRGLDVQPEKPEHVLLLPGRDERILLRVIGEAQAAFDDADNLPLGPDTLEVRRLLERPPLEAPASAVAA